MSWEKKIFSIFLLTKAILMVLEIGANFWIFLRNEKTISINLGNNVLFIIPMFPFVIFILNIGVVIFGIISAFKFKKSINDRYIDRFSAFFLIGSIFSIISSYFQYYPFTYYGFLTFSDYWENWRILQEVELLTIMANLIFSFIGYGFYLLAWNQFIRSGNIKNTLQPGKYLQITYLIALLVEFPSILAQSIDIYDLYEPDYSSSWISANFELLIYGPLKFGALGISLLVTIGYIIMGVRLGKSTIRTQETTVPILVEKRNEITTKSLTSQPFGKEGRDFGTALLWFASGLVVEFIAMLWSIIGYPLTRITIPLGPNLYYQQQPFTFVSNIIIIVLTALTIIYAFRLRKRSSDDHIRRFLILFLIAFISAILFSPFRTLVAGEIFGGVNEIWKLELWLFFGYWLLVLASYIFSLVSWNQLKKRPHNSFKIRRSIVLLQIFSIIGIVTAVISTFIMFRELFYEKFNAYPFFIPEFIENMMFLTVTFSPAILAILFGIGYFIIGSRFMGIIHIHSTTAEPTLEYFYTNSYHSQDSRSVGKKKSKQVNMDTKICPNCGYKIPFGYDFCSYCGSAV